MSGVLSYQCVVVALLPRGLALGLEEMQRSSLPNTWMQRRPLGARGPLGGFRALLGRGLFFALGAAFC